MIQPRTLAPLLGPLCLGLLTVACAAPATPPSGPGPERRVEAIQDYYAEEGLPAGWQLQQISDHNGNVVVTVRLTESVKTYSRRLAGLRSLAFFATICPAPRHQVWNAIGADKDIVVEVVDRPAAATAASCRQHGPRFGGA
jgi:hypothetical protein